MLTSACPETRVLLIWFDEMGSNWFSPMNMHISTFFILSCFQEYTDDDENDDNLSNPSDDSVSKYTRPVVFHKSESE